MSDVYESPPKNLYTLENFIKTEYTEYRPLAHSIHKWFILTNLEENKIYNLSGYIRSASWYNAIYLIS